MGLARASTRASSRERAALMTASEEELLGTGKLWGGIQQF